MSNDNWICAECRTINEYHHQDNHEYHCIGCNRTYTEQQVYYMVILYDDLRSFVIISYPHNKEGQFTGHKWAVCCLRDSSNSKLWNTDPVVYGTRSIDSLIEELKNIKFKRVIKLINK